MVDNQIHQQLDTVLLQLSNQNLGVVHAAVARIYLAIVGDIVAHVNIRALVAWR